MKKAPLLVFGLLLLVCPVFTQSPASSEVNRIVGAKLSVEYNQDKTSATVHVTNVSNKIISSVRISYRYENGFQSRSMSNGTMKPGESIMESVSGARLSEIHLDSIIYADGIQEFRNEAVLAALQEEESQAKEQHAKEMEYARAFAVPDPASHMPQEERIVRNYYAKLNLLSQLQILAGVIMHGAAGLTEAAVRDQLKDEIHVDLAEFQTGDFADIETLPWSL